LFGFKGIWGLLGYNYGLGFLLKQSSIKNFLNHFYRKSLNKNDCFYQDITLSNSVAPLVKPLCCTDLYYTQPLFHTACTNLYLIANNPPFLVKPLALVLSFVVIIFFLLT
jgi:hypothetical protein